MKPLPRGTFWLFVNRLPADLSEENFSAYLRECNLNIPAENLSIRQCANGRSSSCIVAVPREIIATLFNWVVDNRKFKGYSVEAELLRERDGLDRKASRNGSY
jgi:hypothetical protein